MNRPAFEKLIAENLNWLLKQERTLERNHIEAILRDAANRYYPTYFNVPMMLQKGHFVFTSGPGSPHISCNGDINDVQQIRHFLKQLENIEKIYFELAMRSNKV